jgi:hypothetical protein
VYKRDQWKRLYKPTTFFNSISIHNIWPRTASLACLVTLTSYDCRSSDGDEDSGNHGSSSTCHGNWFQLGRNTII